MLREETRGSWKPLADLTWHKAYGGAVCFPFPGYQQCICIFSLTPPTTGLACQSSGKSKNNHFPLGRVLEGVPTQPGLPTNVNFQDRGPRAAPQDSSRPLVAGQTGVHIQGFSREESSTLNADWA